MIRQSNEDIDPAQLQIDLETTALDRLRTGSLALMGMAMVTTLLEALFLRELLVQSLLLGAALLALGVPAQVAIRRGRFPAHRVDAYGALLLLVRMAHLGLAYYRTGSMFYPLLLVNGMIAASGIHLKHRWVIVCLGFGAAAWVPGLLNHSSADMAIGFAVLGGVCVVGTLFYVFRMRHFVHMHTLRIRDQKRGQELAQALAAVERELCDRKRAEEERERLRDQLSHAQKMEAVGTLAGGFAHDLNNILGVVMGLAEIVRDGSSGQMRDDVDQILSSCKRGSELTRNLLGFSRRGQYRVERLDMASVVREVSKLLSRTIPKSVTIDVQLDQGALVIGDSTQLSQVLLNLCLNSVDAMPGGGHLMLRVTRVELDADKAARAGILPGPHVAMSVADSGCGMDAETRQRMFEPFFTTRRERGGTGLGLAMVYGTTMKHNGGIVVESEAGAGTRITVFLPLALPGVAEAMTAAVETGIAPPSNAPAVDAAPVVEPAIEAASIVDDASLVDVAGVIDAAPVEDEPVLLLVRASPPEPAPLAAPPTQPPPVIIEPSAAAAAETGVGLGMEPEPTSSLAEDSPSDPGVRGRILIVDDEPLVRAVVRRILRRAGYRVLEATDGMDGLDMFERHQREIDLVLLDMAMPIMGGAACFARLREIEPSTRVILASGFTAEEDAQRCLGSGALCFLEKPYSSAALLAAVAGALDPVMAPPAAGPGAATQSAPH
jgi:signal transduction histidine kinase/CheY-like chemotaxis protein